MTLLRQRSFALMWWSGLVSFAGDWMLGIARPLFVYQLTGSTLATSLMFVAGMLPRIVLGSVVGVYVDRWNRQRLMVMANLLLALSIVPLLWVRTPDHLWIVYLSALVTSSVAQFLYPAENAFLPTLVSEDQLVAANALNGLNNNLARLTGPAIGGVIMAGLGFQAVILIDAATFVISALLIAAIRRVPLESTGSALPPDVRRVWREWQEGLQRVMRSRTLTLLFMLEAVLAVGQGAMSVLFTPFATDILKTDSVGIGLLMSAQAVGGLLGSVVIARVGNRTDLWKLLGWSCLVFGLIDGVLFNYPLFFPGLAIGIAALIVVGVPGAGVATGLTTALQKETEDAYRGRVFGALLTTSALFELLGMGIAGTLGDIVGSGLINLQVIAYVLGGLFVLTRIRTLTTAPPLTHNA